MSPESTMSPEALYTYFTNIHLHWHILLKNYSRQFRHSIPGYKLNSGVHTYMQKHNQPQHLLHILLAYNICDRNKYDHQTVHICHVCKMFRGMYVHVCATYKIT